MEANQQTQSDDVERTCCSRERVCAEHRVSTGHQCPGAMKRDVRVIEIEPLGVTAYTAPAPAMRAHVRK